MLGLKYGLFFMEDKKILDFVMTFRGDRVEILYRYGKYNMSSYETNFDFDEKNRSIYIHDKKMHWIYNLTFSDDYSFAEKGHIIREGKHKFPIG